MVFGAIAKGLGHVAKGVGNIFGQAAEGFNGPRATINASGTNAGNRSADMLRQQFMEALQQQQPEIQGYNPQMVNASMIDESHVNPYADQALVMSRNAANGNVPSAAGIQQQQGLEQALRSQMAAANSARGGAHNQLAAITGAQNQGAQLQQGAINNAAALRAQEQAAARSLFGQQAFQQAGLQQGLQFANQSAGLQAQGMNQQAYQQAEQARMNAALQSQNLNQNRQSNLLSGLGDAERLRMQGVLGDIDSQTQLASQHQRGKSGIGGGLIGAAGAALALSDKKSKKNVKGGEHEAQKFLDALKSHVYEYKDQYQEQGAPSGQHMSPMAQELEKTVAGKDMVKETPDGMKMVDYSSPQGYGAILAALGHLNEKLKSIEGRRQAHG